MLLRHLQHTTDDDALRCYECGLILEAIERWKPGWLKANSKTTRGYASIDVYRYDGGGLDRVNLDFVDEYASQVNGVGALNVIRRSSGMFYLTIWRMKRKQRNERKDIWTKRKGKKKGRETKNILLMR